MCSVCLGTAIKNNSKKCPKCRAYFSATKVEDIPINHPLESMIKLIGVTENNNIKDLPACTEHQIIVTHRCTTHKAWTCKNCVKEDHSSDSCNTIKISEVLDIRKAKQLSLAKPF